MALSEAGLLSRLREAWPVEESHEDRTREAKFRELALNRLRRIEAPVEVIPTGDSPSLALALADFSAVRRETVAYVEDFRGELRRWLTRHPLITRPVNCYELLLLVAMHPTRHARQIEQIREQLSYSRSQIK